MSIIIVDLLDEMYCFIGLHASTLLDSGKLQQLSYQTLLQLLSADYYIDLPEELVLGLVVDWVNEDFQVSVTAVSSLYTLVFAIIWSVANIKVYFHS